MIAVEKRDARDVAKRIHETTSQIFRFAIARDIASRNPAADFKPRDILAEAQTENRARVDAKDLPELLVKIDGYNGDVITRLAMKLMAYTFVRTNEEIEAPWSEFDLDEARWTIPAERMKMKTPHIVPLSRQAVEILRALKQITGNGNFVFAGARDKKKPISNNTILYALYRLGYRDRMSWRTSAAVTALMDLWPYAGNTSASMRRIVVSACRGDLPINHHFHQSRATLSKLFSSSRCRASDSFCLASPSALRSAMGSVPATKLLRAAR
jgi:integrase